MTDISEESATATRLPRYRRASTPPAMQLSARDIRIVRWVYEMRFVTREQLQRLEFSPSTASYCKRRLALLFHNGFVDRKFIPTPGSFGSTRAIYCLSSKGMQLLAHELQTDIDWRPRDTERELYFLQHTLASNDFRVSATIASRRLGLSMDWTDERTLRRGEMKDYVADPRHDGEKLAVIPDGYFRLHDDEKSLAFALELDRSTVEEKPF
ncbi:MAG: replication-relaxation family protein, partial [bacterium]